MKNNIINALTLVTLFSGISSKGHASQAITGGEELFQRNCSVCHSMKPPPKTAPPVLGIALHYREAFTDRQKAVEHMVRFMQKPDASHSKLEPAAVKRFGLMPAMAMSPDDLKLVSEWFWDQYDPSFRTPGNCK